MGGILSKLTMMGVDYTKLNDWAVYSEYRDNNLKIINTYLDILIDTNYEMIDSNSNFVFADIKFDMPTLGGNSISHILDIYVREKNEPVVRVKTADYDIKSNAKIVSFYDTESNDYVVINSKGNYIRLDKNNQSILKGVPGELVLSEYGADGIAVRHESRVTYNKELRLTGREILALIDEQLNIKQYTK